MNLSITIATNKNMLWFKKKELKESEEYAKVMRKIVDFSAEIARLEGRVSALDVKIEAYRSEVKNVKKKAQEIVDSMEEEDLENNINKDYPSLL
jgi:uncharacterized protein YlxW (UPF0749 family)